MSHLFHQLSRDPFDGEVDLRAPVLGDGARAALAVLEEGLAQGSAILTLTGEPGTGKTTLARVLAARAAPAGVRTVFVHHPQIGFDDLLKLIAAEIGLPDLRTRPTFERLRAIQAALVSALARGGRVLVVIDEAQGLPDETLEALRLLATLEAGPRARPLQILLAGHPDLDARLSRRRWSAVEQRVGARAVLEPMNRRESHEWVEARLAQADPAATAVFTAPALDALARRGRAAADARPARIAGFGGGERPARAARAPGHRAAGRRRLSPPASSGRAWAGLAAGGAVAVALLVVAVGWRAQEGARIETAQETRGAPARVAPVFATAAPPVAAEPLRAAVALSAPPPVETPAPPLRPALR